MWSFNGYGNDRDIKPTLNVSFIRLQLILQFVSDVSIDEGFSLRGTHFLLPETFKVDVPRIKFKPFKPKAFLLKLDVHFP